MSLEAIRQAFPTRPLGRPDTPGRRKARLWVPLLTLLAALPALYWTVTSWQVESLRRDLAARGVEAEILDSQGTCYGVRGRITRETSTTGCDLTIRYRLRGEHGGEVRTAEVRSNGEQPLFAPPALYDPDDPSRVMLKPEVDAGISTQHVVITAILWLMPALVLLVGWALTRPGLARAARDPRPVLVPIVQAVQVGHGQLHVKFETPSGRQVTDAFQNAMPFLVPAPAGEDPGRDWALALLGRNGRPYLLDSRLEYLDFTENERSAIRAAAAA